MSKNISIEIGDSKPATTARREISDASVVGANLTASVGANFAASVGANFAASVGANHTPGEWFIVE